MQTHCFLPGVLQIEAMAQLGGILMIDPENDTAKNNFFFGGIDNCKWRKPVVPGDCLVSTSLQPFALQLFASKTVIMPLWSLKVADQ